LLLCILSITAFGLAPRPRPSQEAVAQYAAEVEYQRLDVKPYQCPRSKRYVVGDDLALQALISDCKNSEFKLPRIDFSKQTLIAMFANTDWCVKLRLKITRDDTEKLYRHTTIADRPLRCRGIGSVPFWVLVPKLVPGYEVTFERRIEPNARLNSEPPSVKLHSVAWPRH
jgi:hypothetical protein